ncbi:MAG: class I SAM-dependent methyltransferase [Candidatus Adiutrix sp.]|jgi:SAM-dependent methyltransferase|nr:class I SAM-dependent methyltransferase [Candidatus Adiutrix sp.]
MPDIRWNLDKWNNRYDWRKNHGEEWSQAWGSSTAQWLSTIYPRIRCFLPARRILEIAPGYGRWTKFLIGAATEAYRAVDLAGPCVRYCQDAFSAPHPDFKAILNDGYSLAGAADWQYDFIFSFDSMIHASPDVLEAYIRQILESLLSREGVCFIHHSNLKAVRGNPGFDHAHDPDVSAELAADLVSAYRGKVLSQEIITWGETAGLGAITVFAGRNCPYEPRRPLRFVNENFMAEAALAKNVFSRYLFQEI